MRLRRTKLQLLNDKDIARLIRDNTVGRHGDGGGLHLQCRAGRAPAWVLRYVSPVTGKQRDVTLITPASLNNTATARRLAREARDQLAQGIDPRDAQIKQAAATRVEQEETRQERVRAGLTLRKAGEELHELLCQGRLRTVKGRAQWLSRLECNVPKEIWNKPVAEISEDGLRGFMEPLWVKKHPTAKKVRQRLEAIFNRVRKYAGGVNPAANIRRDLLTLKSKHWEHAHRALPFAEMPAFVRELRQRKSVSARALEFLILTAARTKEVVELEWADIHGDVWIVPEEKMKGEESEQEPHTVFLCKRAVQILDEVRDLDARIVFPSSQRQGERMNAETMSKLIQDMGMKARMTPTAKPPPMAVRITEAMP